MLGYRREIDGLRAVAVLPVILFHAGFSTFGGGYVGVDVFFVISGYLITSILLSDLEAGRFSLLRFYERRIRRILPALFLVLGTSLVLAWFLFPTPDMTRFSRSLTAVSLFASNILFWRESGYFDVSAELKPLLHTWSLAVEEQYYLLFPILVLLCWKIRRQWLFPAVAIAAIASLAIAEWGAYHRPAAAFYLLPTRVWELAAGAMAAMYLARQENRHSPTPAPLLYQLAAACGLSMIVGAVLFFDKNTPFPSLYTLVPVVGAMLLILFADDRTMTGRILGLGLPVGLGLISYSAYLWHQPLFAFSRQQGLMHAGSWTILLPAALSVLLGWLSWRFVERPFRDPVRIRRRTVFASAAVGSIAFATIGLIGTETEGFLFRFPEPDRIIHRQMAAGGDYVAANYQHHIAAPFDLVDPKPKVLLIGDSYSQDMTNALYESGLVDRMQLSTIYIPARCGNVYGRHEELQRGVGNAEDRILCAREGSVRYQTDVVLRTLLDQADVVWLVSAWTVPTAEMLPSAIANLSNDHGNVPVLVFGTKEFLLPTLQIMLGMTLEERVKTPPLPSPDLLHINEILSASIPPNRFVDVMGLLCGPTKTCPPFTSDGALLSYDGGHLTQRGADQLGRALLHEPVIRAFLP